MFTGIVEEIGTIQSIKRNPNSLQFKIACTTVLSDVSLGDSISVNGVCLTVHEHGPGYFTADVMPETVKATTLHTLQIGSPVNLERAMAANGRFGGHFVSGHVDGTGEIISVRRHENAKYMEIKTDQQLLKYFIDKGSVTVDGTSLTIFEITGNGFVISLIPVTQADSIIGEKQLGDFVNIECDMLAKYMENLLSKRSEQPATNGITKATLAESGFLNG
ncbi:riboflavin synthase [Oceanobacillus sp. AG]|uniref:riboflavin synthase n=1 Tax=Oceanobacillus sp. AG TaxID=2681969 RepID=UPI0012EB696F|nr:riboflavin synthase [Oceanobacillus sp. AG]